MCLRRVEKPLLPDSTHVHQLSMSQLVGQTVHARRVRCIDLSCNAAMAGMSLVLVAFGVAMLALSILNYGGASRMIPAYIILGLTSVVGIVLTVSSIFRMLQTCHKKVQFQEEIKEIYSQI